jgi:hypothetical protein
MKAVKVEKNNGKRVDACAIRATLARFLRISITRYFVVERYIALVDAPAMQPQRDISLHYERDSGFWDENQAEDKK